MEEFLILLKDHYDLSKLSELFTGIIKSLTIHYLSEIFVNNKIEININPFTEKDINYEKVYLTYPLINHRSVYSYCRISLNNDFIPQFHVCVFHSVMQSETEIKPNLLDINNDDDRCIENHPLKSSKLIPSILRMYREGIQLAKAKIILYCQTLYKDILMITNTTERIEKNLYHIEITFNGDVFKKIFQNNMLFVIQKAGNWIVKIKWNNNISPINCACYNTLQTKSQVQITNEAIILKYYYNVSFPEFIEDISSFSKNFENKKVIEYSSNNNNNIFEPILDFNGLTVNVKCQSCRNV